MKARPMSRSWPSAESGRYDSLAARNEMSSRVVALRGRERVGAAASVPPLPRPVYFGNSVTGTSVIESTGSLLAAAALRIAASSGPSYTQ